MLLDEKIKQEAAAGRKHYVYIAKQGNKVVYVGKGSGTRYKHTINGNSQNIGVNRYYFKAELLGEKPLTVTIPSFFEEERDALDEENKVIEATKPECNITLLPYHEQFPIIYQDKNIFDVYEDRFLMETLLKNVEFLYGYKLYDNKEYISAEEFENGVRSLHTRTYRKGYKNRLAIIPDTYIDVIKPKGMCRRTGDVKTLQRSDRELKLPTELEIEALSYPLAPNTRVLNFKKYLGKYPPEDRPLLVILECMVMCGALEHKLIFHTMDKNLRRSILRLQHEYK